MEITTDTGYAVALHDHPGLGAAERIAAEVRYCRALERQLGSPDDVAHLLRAVTRAANGDEEPSDEARRLFVQWTMANRAARQAAFAGGSDAPQAWFDVRLA